MSTEINMDIHNVPVEADVDVTTTLSSPLPTEPAAARSEAMSLLALQKQLDSDISRHLSTLSSHGVNMATPLVDAQGFPLANKDLMAIRTAKQRINVLKNDSKALRERTAKLLELAINGDAVPQSTAGSSKGVMKEELEAFAKVNSVAAGSPAEEAGLKAGDHVVTFGSVTADSEKGLAGLAAPGVVADGKSVQLLLRRDGAEVALTLTPRAGWGGRGLLGCHLLPL